MIAGQFGIFVKFMRYFIPILKSYAALVQVRITRTHTDECHVRNVLFMFAQNVEDKDI